MFCWFSLQVKTSVFVCGTSARVICTESTSHTRTPCTRWPSTSTAQCSSQVAAALMIHDEPVMLCCCGLFAVFACWLSMIVAAEDAVTYMSATWTCRMQRWCARLMSVSWLSRTPVLLGAACLSELQQSFLSVSALQVAWTVWSNAGMCVTANSLQIGGLQFNCYCVQVDILLSFTYLSNCTHSNLVIHYVRRTHNVCVTYDCTYDVLHC